MIGLDTNVLVRYFTQDDPGQSRRATAFIEAQCTEDNAGFVSTVVLCELTWVLDSGYGYKRTDIARLLRGMLSAPALLLENHDRVNRAVSLYEKGVAGFPDCLIACSCDDALAVPVYTFDQAAIKTTSLFRKVP